MKIYFILSVSLCLCALILPLFSVSYTEKSKTEVCISESEKNYTAESTEDDSVRVMRTATGEETNISLFEYIVGTVAGEMPASFSQEALKAQAVVSYTYAKWIAEQDGYNDYITDSSSLHQKYIDKTEQKEKWKSTYDANRARIEKAVRSVYGEYLTFENKTAMTVFHALSSGSTLSAKEVWGDEVPYLVSVEAPGDKIAEKYESAISITDVEFKELFEAEGVVFENDDLTTWISIKEKTEKNYIRTLTVSSKDFTSREIRKILSLPGNSFNVKAEGNSFLFTVHGKGHGVGMSQYSADFMARQGKSYSEILAHFYPGTSINKE